MSSRTTLLDLAPSPLLRELTRPWSPPPGSLILVAASGGADSTALLHLLAALSAGRGWRVAAATLDHGLRGDAGAADRRFVERLAARLSLPCRSARCAAPAPPGRSPEEAARDARREFLTETARELGADAVALAHTADDQAETVLFRLGRGTGTLGLGAMPRWRAPFWRPLLDVRRHSLREVLERGGLAWREDETNRSRRATRNRIRHDLLPLVESTLGPGAVRALARTARIAREDEALLSDLARRELRSIELRRSGHRIELDRRALARLPVPVARRVLRIALGTVGCPGRRLASPHLVSALELARARGPGTRLDLPDGVTVAREGPSLTIERAAAAAAGSEA